MVRRKVSIEPPEKPLYVKRDQTTLQKRPTQKKQLTLWGGRDGSPRIDLRRTRIIT